MDPCFQIVFTNDLKLVQNTLRDLEIKKNELTAMGSLAVQPLSIESPDFKLKVLEINQQFHKQMADIERQLSNYSLVHERILFVNRLEVVQSNLDCLKLKDMAIKTLVEMNIELEHANILATTLGSIKETLVKCAEELRKFREDDHPETKLMKTKYKLVKDHYATKSDIIAEHVDHLKYQKLVYSFKLISASMEEIIKAFKKMPDSLQTLEDYKCDVCSQCSKIAADHIETMSVLMNDKYTNDVLEKLVTLERKQGASFQNFEEKKKDWQMKVNARITSLTLEKKINLFKTRHTNLDDKQDTLDSNNQEGFLGPDCAQSIASSGPQQMRTRSASTSSVLPEEKACELSEAKKSDASQVNTSDQPMAPCHSCSSPMIGGPRSRSRVVERNLPRHRTKRLASSPPRSLRPHKTGPEVTDLSETAVKKANRGPQQMRTRASTSSVPVKNYCDHSEDEKSDASQVNASDQPMAPCHRQARPDEHEATTVNHTSAARVLSAVGKKSSSAAEFQDQEEFGIAPKVLRARQEFGGVSRDATRVHGDTLGVAKLLQAATERVGERILRKQGWRHGEGIVPKVSQQEKRETRKKNEAEGDPTPLNMQCRIVLTRCDAQVKLPNSKVAMRKPNPYQYLVPASNFKSKRDKDGMLVCPACPKRTKNRSHMLSHIRNHTQEKPYGCTLCTKTFSESHHLTSHMNVVHMHIRPFGCSNCKFKTTKKSHLIDHQQAVHLHLKKFKCVVCKYRTTTKNNLSRHVKRNHKIRM